MPIRTTPRMAYKESVDVVPMSTTGALSSCQTSDDVGLWLTTMRIPALSASSCARRELETPLHAGSPHTASIQVDLRRIWRPTVIVSCGAGLSYGRFTRNGLTELVVGREQYL